MSDCDYHVADVGLDETPENENIYYTFKGEWQAPFAWDINHEAIAGRPDHLSFHTNGNVHLKHKGMNRAKGRGRRLPLYHPLGVLSGGLLPQTGDTLTPLLIDSIYRHDGGWPLVKREAAKVPTAHPWAFLEVADFSILVFLADRNRCHASFPYVEGLEELSLHRVALYIPFCENWVVVICLTLYTLPEIFPEALPTFGLQCSRDRIPEFPRHVVVPNRLAFQHLSFGRSLFMPH